METPETRKGWNDGYPTEPHCPPRRKCATCRKVAREWAKTKAAALKVGGVRNR